MLAMQEQLPADRSKFEECHMRMKPLLGRFAVGSVMSLLVVASTAAPTAAEKAAATKGMVKRSELEIVDCLLPGQVRQLGNSSYLTQRRPVRTTASECSIRGGEYVAYDRADLQSALRVWMQAAEGGNLEGVRVLVRRGADVNVAIRPWGLTALMLATGQGHLEIVKTLLKAGANPNAVAFGHGGVPGWAWMAAMNRCHERWLEMTDAMLAAGVELNPKGIYPSPLGYAIEENDTVMIEALLKRGANVNLADSETGDTLLIFAVRFSTPEVVAALIEAGADVNARNKSGQTVLMVADQKDNLWRNEIVGLLRKRGAKL